MKSLKSFSAKDLAEISNTSKSLEILSESPSNFIVRFVMTFCSPTKFSINALSIVEAFARPEVCRTIFGDGAVFFLGKDFFT